uniref:AIG1-type G domain-containing protein n=1 Tax=Amphilophus citrinellus TaxID=61819 RepID=A0A3Q0RV15_AMPCI
CLSVSELRVVLLGNSLSQRSSVGNFILGETKFSTEEKLYCCMKVCGLIDEKTIALINTPDLLDPNISEDKLTEFLKQCVNLSAPGPHVFLLVLQPEDFTEEQQEKLQSILKNLSDQAFKHSLVLISALREESTNLVLCGSGGTGKTSVVSGILGQKKFNPPTSSSECVKHQGEVCGHWVSLVELPALYGKPQETVMEESLRCISLCDPEGVHAFILVLPVAPLTDEDKGELETIQNTFSSRVNDFTMILFTVESDPTDPAVVNFVSR